MTDIVAGPYLYLEPEHAYLLDNGERAVGYYLAVRQVNVNARRFYERLGWCPIEVRDAEPGTYLVHPTS